ncbi:serine hydrolase [Pseudomonas sp. SIMBA_059]
MVRGLLCVALLFVTVTAPAETWPDKEWAKGTALSGHAVDALDAYAFPARDDVTRKGIRTDALLVIRDGQIIYERYGAPTTASTPHLTWSVSKSLMATVLGVAYGENRFKLSDPVARFYPPMKQHPTVTMADLLHWASGLDWQEDYEYAPLNSSVVAMLYTRGRGDMADFAADTASVNPPGQAFRYSSGDSNILSAALKGMLGHKAYMSYPWDALFKPLGIHNATWETDANETFVASSYAYLTARDLARVGLLMARDGRWGDQQLLRKDWVAFNRQPFDRYKAGQDDAVPGGHWWLNKGVPQPWPDAPADTFAALGHWGQALFVMPDEHLVIVRYADDRDGSYRHNELLKRVLAAVQP